MKLRQLLGSNKKLIDKIEQHREKLYRVAYAWTHDSMLCEDLVQETLLIGMQKVYTLRDEKALTGWLFSILNNQWRQYLRKQKPQVDIDDLVFESDSSPLEACNQQQISLSLKTAMQKLSISQRQVITMVDLEDLSYIEVSQALNVPIGTVMSRLSRARGNLLSIMSTKKITQLTPHLRSVK